MLEVCGLVSGAAVVRSHALTAFHAAKDNVALALTDRDRLGDS